MLNKLFACTMFVCALLSGCNDKPVSLASYNTGINIIPKPQDITEGNGFFRLNRNTSFLAADPELQKVAAFFASRINRSTGFNLEVLNQENVSGNAILLKIDPLLQTNEEGYTLDVTKEKVTVKAKSTQGIFYGLQSFLQLLPAEIESQSVRNGISWVAPCVSIKDEPRFGYRGMMLDPCRHFMSVEEIKKQLDVLSLFKINRMHWHLTDDQGWRIEIKKYPKLTGIGAIRTEGEGFEYGGFYTQEEVKEIVRYAADRFITIIPEIELPGHEMAAIAAYPELSCKSELLPPRIIWGVEDIVLCAGKESTFEFLENVFKEIIQLFPGEYIHIGGDECPKTEWEKCPFCQKRIREKGLTSQDGHTPEERLQSYFVQRMEKVLAGYGKKIIGWDEILEGGLAPTATVMSWRGQEGGIAAASMDHEVIMTPQNDGMYLDRYEGDYKIDPVTIGGKATIEDVYRYNPTPDTLIEMDKAHYIKGVQCNTWSEYMYSNDLREYRIFPRILALAEIAWTDYDLKDYKDFERRIENACVRLDGHGINYYIPQPEQPEGSCNFVAFTDNALLEFITSRPIQIVYTTDGTEPTSESETYHSPIQFTESGILKIRSVLPSGKMSPTRVITVEKQTYAPAKDVDNKKPGLKMQVMDGMYLKTSDIPANATWKESTIHELREITQVVKTSESMRGVNQYAAIASGYVAIPEEGVYYFSSDLEQVWIDGKMLISNEGETKRFSRNDKSIALGKGLHEIRAVFLGHIIGGWPSNWNNGSILIRRSDVAQFSLIKGEQLFH